MNQIATDAIDHDLISKFKAGSMEAMEKIVERYEERIFTFGLKMCGHLQDAEDIAQETFLNAFRYLKDFREETKLKNWLFKIAASACIRKRRKKKCEPDFEISLDSFIPQEGDDMKYEIPDWSDDPSDNMMRTELKKIIDAAIHSLSHKYRLVFTLRDIEGFNTQETADILGISTQSVKTRLHRARLYLREKISKSYKEGVVQ
ncbi:MAG: sigma-70 family RNA polymerase sigma factor [Deltaproteobacteria bacterium]|nr:sigma-70 family RNA polymerase sigma factor [Deltaproteobacteria bacterium]